MAAAVPSQGGLSPQACVHGPAGRRRAPLTRLGRLCRHLRTVGGGPCRAVAWLPARQRLPQRRLMLQGPVCLLPSMALRLIVDSLLGILSLKEHVEPGPVIHTVGSSVSEGKRSEKACCAWRVARRPGSPGAASTRGLTLVPPNVTMRLLPQQAQWGCAVCALLRLASVLFWGDSFMLLHVVVVCSHCRIVFIPCL